MAGASFTNVEPVSWLRQIEHTAFEPFAIRRRRNIHGCGVKSRKYVFGIDQALSNVFADVANDHPLVLSQRGILSAPKMFSARHVGKFNGLQENAIR